MHFYKQYDSMDCAPTCVRMVAKHYKRNISLQQLREKTQIGKEGVNLLGISEAAEAIGFKCRGIKVSFNELIQHAAKPAILHWKQNHFVVLTPKAKQNQITIADPAKGIISYTKKEFFQNWASITNGDENIGVALLLEPTPQLYEQQDEKENKVGWAMLYGYLMPQKKLIFQLFIGLMTTTYISLSYPTIVDIDIRITDKLKILLFHFSSYALSRF